MRTNMLCIGRLALGFCMAGAALMAQTVPQPSVQAVGNASIAVQPDQAQLTVSVTTQSTTAQDAGTQNANVSYTLMTALSAVVGSNGSIQTESYSVYPRYSN